MMALRIMMAHVVMKKSQYESAVRRGIRPRSHPAWMDLCKAVPQTEVEGEDNDDEAEETKADAIAFVPKAEAETEVQETEPDIDWKAVISEGRKKARQRSRICSLTIGSNTPGAIACNLVGCSSQGWHSPSFGWQSSATQIDSSRPQWLPHPLLRSGARLRD